jgi:serine/threonine-protein kinase SRPK3
MATPPSLVQEMIESVNDDLPERWRPQWQKMQTALEILPEDYTSYTLQEWLNETYFSVDKKADFTRESMLKFGELVTSMMRFEPSMRASAQKVLQDHWFDEAA